MKLATIDNKTRDGQLVVVNKELTHAIAVQDVAATLQEALDNWTRSKPQLEKIYNDLNKGNTSGAFPFEMDNALAPLPRAYQWLDGSIYHPHLALLLKAAGMEIPNPEKSFACIKELPTRCSAATNLFIFPVKTGK
jgi:fumarylacetoacetate (FAA) hydrolase